MQHIQRSRDSYCDVVLYKCVIDVDVDIDDDDDDDVD